MGSETAPLRLPLIDFTKTDLNPGTAQWDLVKGQVHQALQEYGCFKASFDKIPVELRRATFGASEELFDLPLEIKRRNINKTPFHGYVGQYSQTPLFESLNFEDADIIEKVEAHINTFWPQGNSSCSKMIQSYSKQLSELDQMIRRMILESFELENYMDEHMNSMIYFLRLSKYTGPKSNETRVALPAHIDKDIITILCQNEVDGLEVQSKDGEWINVKLSKGSFIVIMGESFHAWLNGRLHAPYHRVMMSGDNIRYSVSLFTIPKEGYIIKTPEELVDEAHPLLFKPFEYIEFLRFYYSKQQTCYVDTGIKDYCGV